MRSRFLCGVCRDAAPTQSRGTRAVVRAVPRWTNGDGDRDLARVASSGCAARAAESRMRFPGLRHLLALLCLALLVSACKQSNSVAPPATTQGEQAAAVPSPS